MSSTNILWVLCLVPCFVMGQKAPPFYNSEASFPTKKADPDSLDLETAYAAFEENQDTIGMIEVLQKMGEIKRKQSALREALPFYQKSIDLSGKMENKSVYSSIVKPISELYFLLGQTRLSIPLLREGIRIDLALGETQQASSKMIDLGQSYTNLGQLDSAKVLLEKGMAIKREIGHQQGIAEGYSSLANLNLHLGNIAKARDYEQKCLELRMEQRDSARMIKSYKSLANIFMLLDDIENMQIYAQKGYLLADRLGVLSWKAACLSSLASSNEMRDSLNKAVLQYKEVIQMNRKLGIRKRLVSNLLDLSEIYIRQHKPAKAEELLVEARNIANLINTKTSTIRVLLFYGGLHYRNNKPELALPLFLEAAFLADSLSMKYFLKEISHKLAQTYGKLGQYQRALKWQQSYSILADTIYQKEKQETIYELETRHQVNEKEKQIELLFTQNELNALQLQTARRRQFFLGLGLSALVGMAVLGGYFYRSKQRDNRLLEEKNEIIGLALSEKELLLKEIHHRVKNNLQVVSSLLSMQAHQIKEPQALEAVREGKNRVRSMALIHQSLYQDANLLGVDSQTYIEELAQSLFNSYNVNPDFVFMETKVDPLKLDVDTMIPLGLILNELISNALKYAFQKNEKGLVSIQLRKEANILQLSVRDNGIGLPDEFNLNKAESMGFLIVKDFCRKLKATLQVLRRNGTEVNLSIPYPS